MRDGVTTGPKPMAMVGERPLLWHVMRYYAHFGHTDFVLCLGYGASHVKDFFLDYDETRSNDFALENGAREVKLFSTDISDWRITFVDTGLHSAIGERLRLVRRFVEGEAMFMANYADVLTNASLPNMIERFETSGAVASLLAVPPQSSHHVVDIADDGLITQVTPMRDLRQWENGGYFLLRPEIFDYLKEGEDLVEDAIMRMLAKRPEERFAHHNAGGRLANSMASRYGTRLRPDLTKRLGPYPTRDAAEAAETRLRRRLERRGWVVYGGTGRRLFEDWANS